MPKAPMNEQRVTLAPIDPRTRITSAPTAETYGADIGDQGVRVGVEWERIQAHKDYLEQQALAHSLTAQATADYRQATSDLTEQSFQDNPLRPDLAKQQIIKGMAQHRQRVISQYAGNDKLFGAQIAGSLAQSDIASIPHLALRTTKAISDNAKAAAEMSAQQAAQDYVKADNEPMREVAINNAATAYAGLRGNAMSDQAVHDGMAATTAQMAQGRAEKEVQQNPIGVLARLSGLTIDSPELAGLTVGERVKAREERQAVNGQAIATRMEMTGDVLKATLNNALQSGIIGMAGDFGYLALTKKRGEKREASLMDAAMMNHLSENQLAMEHEKEPLLPEAYGKVLAVIHTTQDRIRLNLERQQKDQEKAVKQHEGDQINEAYTALKKGELLTETMDDLVRQGTFTEHRDEYRGLLNGLEAQAKAGGVGDVEVANRIQRGLYMGVTYTKPQLTDPRLNWDQQKANLDLQGKMLSQGREDHWSRQPEVQAQYRILDRQHKISNATFSENPPPRVANVQKMWTDLMDASAKRGEPLGPAAEQAVKQIGAAFPVHQGYQDLPQPTLPALKPWLESVTKPEAKTKLSPKQAAQAVQRMVQSGQLNLSDPTTREQVGLFLDILDVLPQEPVNAGQSAR